MSSGIKNECFINGVEYKCRTCFDPGQTVYSLTDEASKAKTWRDLLKDFGKLQINDEDLLPNTVCCKCLEKLRSIYDFILQIEYVNKKYSKLLESCNDPLHEGVLNDIDNFNNCLAIDLPLEQDISKIKLEEELVDPYNIVLEDNNQLSEDCETKFENEDTDDDPFSKTYDDDDFNSTSEQLEEKESVKATNSQRKTKPKRRKKAVSSENEIYDEECKYPQRRRRITKTAIQPKESDNTLQTEKEKHSNEDDDDNVKVKPNVCPICSKTFKYKKYVDEHVKIVHEKLKPFKCLKCEKTFASKHTLRIHELSHTDNFPFQCEYCDRRFRVISKLRIHTEIHTTKPELLCPICKRSQKSTKDLEEHVKSHDDKRLQCNSCGKLFTRNSTLNDHYNAVHLKLRPYKCQYCELGFGDRKTRRMHERKHHPKDPAIS